MNGIEKDQLAVSVVNQMMKDDLFSQWLGIKVLDVKEGYSKMEMMIRDEMMNGLGIVHGGIAFSLADSAFAFACNRGPWLLGSVADRPLCTFCDATVRGDGWAERKSHRDSPGKTACGASVLEKSPGAAGLSDSLDDRFGAARSGRIRQDIDSFGHRPGGGGARRDSHAELRRHPKRGIRDRRGDRLARAAGSGACRAYVVRGDGRGKRPDLGGMAYAADPVRGL